MFFVKHILGSGKRLRFFSTFITSTKQCESIVLSVTKRAKYKGKYNSLWLAVTYYLTVLTVSNDKIML